MGWTGLYRHPGMSDREFFEKEFPDGLGKWGHIVACSTKNGAFYAAIQNHEDHPSRPNETWALVVLVQRGKGQYNFHYKDMSEDMGPAVDEASAAVLDALSPTTHEYAVQWRERCRENLAKQAVARKVRATVKDGDVIEYERELNFANDRKVRRFRKEGARWIALTMDGVALFRCNLGREWTTKHGSWTKLPTC